MKKYRKQNKLLMWWGYFNYYGANEAVRWILKTFYNQWIKRPFYALISFPYFIRGGIENLFKWFRPIWNDNNGTLCSFYEILQFKLIDLRKSVDNV